MNFEKLEIIASIYFRGKNHFEDDGTQDCLVFQTAYKYFKIVILIMIFYHVILKDCLMKILSLLLQLIIFLILY